MKNSVGFESQLQVNEKNRHTKSEAKIDTNRLRNEIAAEENGLSSARVNSLKNNCSVSRLDLSKLSVRSGRSQRGAQASQNPSDPPQDGSVPGETANSHTLMSIKIE